VCPNRVSVWTFAMTITPSLSTPTMASGAASSIAWNVDSLVGDGAILRCAIPAPLAGPEARGRIIAPPGCVFNIHHGASE
jgi:hypothetical protein